jgi:hypothetical protein
MMCLVITDNFSSPFFKSTYFPPFKTLVEKGRPYLKNNQCKRAECLPSKCEALSSTPCIAKTKTKTKPILKNAK